MRKITVLRSWFWLALGIVLGGLLVPVWRYPAKAQTAAETTGTTLQADVTHLKDALPPAGHPMVDVGYHAVNLWFAVQRKNWPLATYYLNETRNRIQWAARMNPMLKGPGGAVDLKGIFDGMDNGTLKAIKQTIDNKDGSQFPTAYRHMLEDCYGCHKAVGRPYLRPMVPTTPQQAIINTDPAATWPK
jgi:hypothetical protein